MDRLLQLMTEALKPGVMGAAGMKLEKSLAKDLKAYFHGVMSKVKDLKLEEVLSQTSDTARHAVDMRTSNLLRRMSPVLKDTLKQHLLMALEAGKKQGYHIKEADDNSGNYNWDSFASTLIDGIDQLGLSGEKAAAWAEDRAAQLVTDINETTRKRIADAVETAIQDQLGPQKLASMIRAIDDEFEMYRAKMIASTELNFAFSTASLDLMGSDGMKYKTIILSPDACDEICGENEDAGPIPMDDAFPSGDFAPPFHPNCRCALVGSWGPDGPPDEGDDA